MKPKWRRNSPEDMGFLERSGSLPLFVFDTLIRHIFATMNRYLSRVQRLWKASVLTLAIASCTNEPPYTDPEQYLPSEYNEGIGSSEILHSVWVGNRIYTASPIRYYELDEGYDLIHDSVPFASTETNSWPPVPDSILDGFFSLRANTDGSKLLGVLCSEFDISNGSLVEIDTKSWLTTELLPATRNISSALYLSDDSIIFFRTAVR
jgi:hypothetical protein